MKKVALLLVMTAAPMAFGHGDHGLPGSHWHASDVWGFVAVAAVVVLLLAGRK